MANEVAQTLTLQEKVSERIKQQIGELIEPADLKRLVERAIDEAFFTKKPVHNSYGREMRQPEPLIVATVRELLRPMVEEQVTAWMVANDGKVREMLDGIVRDGVLGVVTQQLNGRMQSDLYTFGNMLSQRLVGKSL